MNKIADTNAGLVKGALIASAVWAAVIVSCVLFWYVPLVEYEVPTREGWPQAIKVTRISAGEEMRLIDTRTGYTVYKYSEALPMQPSQVEDLGDGSWRITIKKIH